MSDESKEFRVMALWELSVSHDANPDSQEFTLLSVSPSGGKIEFKAEKLLELESYIEQNAMPFSRESDSLPEVSQWDREPCLPPGLLSRLLEKTFVERLLFWTSSRGDHWEQIAAKSAEEAAMKQAERWSQLGYRGPFSVMVSLSGVPTPPKSGDRVWIFDIKPEVTMKATKLDYKVLG